MRKFLSLTIAAFATSLLLTNCVSSRKYQDSQNALQSARNDSARLAGEVASLGSQVKGLQANIGQLKQQVEELTNKTGQLSSDVAGKQSQLSKSREELAAQQKRLEQLQALMDQQKHAIQEIRKKMSDALVGFSSKELSVAIKNGKVYVSLQENLLFPSGSAVVNPKGKEALSKLAAVLITNPDITVDIEGHTDSIPIHGRYQDNWDLSTARANSIVRVLTADYKVEPSRVIASGHAWYDPVQSNSTPEGRALNRRTEIILSPKLDELYRLLESGADSTGSANATGAR